jgi:hypothetical protein
MSANIANLDEGSAEFLVDKELGSTHITAIVQSRLQQCY